jgi:hypothetical protein
LRLATEAAWLGVLSLALAACSGGSSDSAPPPPAPTPPAPPTASPGTLSLSAASYEVAESSTTASFMVTRTGGSDGEVSVDITASAGSATAGVDFGTITTTATFTDGDRTAKTGTVAIFDDSDEEPDETIALTLSNVTGGATIGTQDTAVITIRDDDAPAPSGGEGRHLNDSGVTACVNGAGSEFDCASGNGGIDDYPGQDGSVGRDVSDDDDADGRAGFSFVKLGSAGDPLPDQGADYATTPWECVRDNVTGLVWEIKTDDGGLRDRDWHYTWSVAGEVFDAAGSQKESAGECANSGRCDTVNYAADVNAGGLCGFDDWRLPSRHELISLVDFGTPASAAIDTGYFPQVATAPYWTASIEPHSSLVKFVEFNEGLSPGAPRDEAFRIRLVRGGF